MLTSINDYYCNVNEYQLFQSEYVHGHFYHFGNSSVNTCSNQLIRNLE